MTEINIPPYIYENRDSEKSLLQGDILGVSDKFRQHFTEFYPGIKHPEGENKYVMVLTQSCDLVKTEKRKPKLNHINVCLVRSLKSVIERLIAEINPPSIDNRRLLQRDAFDQLKDKLSKLLNNSDQKTHFFLPEISPFQEDMVAILPLSFSFRTEHYDLFLKSRVLGLKPEFQAKVGYTISQLYGRIGTPDLSDCGWDDKKTRNFINNLLHDFNFKQVPDKSYIDYIQEKYRPENSAIHTLIQECAALKATKSFEPVKNELVQNIKSQLIKIFQDQEQTNRLNQMDIRTLSKEIDNILKSAKH